MEVKRTILFVEHHYLKLLLERQKEYKVGSYNETFITCREVSYGYMQSVSRRWYWKNLVQHQSFNILHCKILKLHFKYLDCSNILQKRIIVPKISKGQFLEYILHDTVLCLLLCQFISCVFCLFIHIILFYDDIQLQIYECIYKHCMNTPSCPRSVLSTVLKM